jgi:endonuclease III
MAKAKSRLAKILDRLEKYYGKPKPASPSDPYEMVLHRICGYPQSDVNCDKGFHALKEQIGTSTAAILNAPDAKLAAALRSGGIVPELRARRLKEVAARVEDEFGGNLRAALKLPVNEARKVFKKFPTIGDSYADKILLMTKTAAVGAVPATGIHVPLRLGFGKGRGSYAADYKEAQAAILAEIPYDIAQQTRAYLLLKRHSMDICKVNRPRCEECPVGDECGYYAATRRGE